MVINTSQKMQCSKLWTNLVLVVGEKHILQLKFQQKLQIDDQKIKKKSKLLGRNLLILDQTVNDLSCI